MRKAFLASLLAGVITASIAVLSTAAYAHVLPNVDTHQVSGGCMRPTRALGPHSVFYGVKATAKSQTTESEIVAITPHDEAHLWCALSFVINEEHTPFTVQVSFLSKATPKDLALVKDFLRSSHLFSKVSVPTKRIWVPTRPGT